MSWWKNLLKVAIPVGAAVAAPFTGGGSLGLLGLGAGAGAATGALNGGWKGALTGAAGGAASGLAGSKIKGMMGGTAKAGAGIPGGFTGPAQEQANPDFTGPTQEQAGFNAGSSGPGGGNFFSNLLQKGTSALSGNGQGADANLADLGSVIGAFGQGESTNRYVKGGLTQGYDQLNMQAEQQNRAQETDALKKLAQTGYLKAGGAPPINRVVNSGTMPDLGFGPKPASEAQMTGAGTLEETLLKRLTPEGQVKPTDPSGYLNPGTAENIGKWGALAAGGLGTVATMFNKPKF